ncbi:hypothetical protein, partial [Vibrio breoganii]|uniref:hypothetical protein n=1 Tax=Vibrio breoganii TaxID=553239 RepID=UPI001054B8CA
MNLDTISLVITALADTQEALGLDELCATHSVSQTAVNEAVERMQTHHTHRAIETNIAGIINHAKIDNIRLSELYASSFMGRDPDMRKVELG